MGVRKEARKINIRIETAPYTRATPEIFENQTNPIKYGLTMEQVKKEMPRMNQFLFLLPKK
jgi:hypothetical protein